MTRMKLWIAIVVMMFATVGHAGKAEAASDSYYLTGSQLLEWCEGASRADQNVCVGYLAGISDITKSYKDWGRSDSGYCIPESVKTDQLKKVVIKGLNENPEDLHLTASSLVFYIFYDAFPCD